MCGIYGAVTPGGAIDLEAVVRRRDRLAHRGPDDAGVWLSEDRRVALAHRRLSIIDLSAQGHQPMASEDGRSVLVFNGELYNFRALREELRGLQFRFRSASDTEVVLHAYRAWGVDCLKRFNGMFAFALYDTSNARTGPLLFLARDRAGEKPLYYAQVADSFHFASELKALEARSGLDARALNFYLALGYVPGELCLARGVKKLPPAHAARFRLQDGTLEVWRYWSLPANRGGAQASGEELAAEAERLLVDSVGLRLVSDVPLGVLLSGGMDSSLVVAAAARQSTRPVKTFTVTFPGSRYDEGPYAGQVARHFGTEHHVLEVPKPSLETLCELAPLVDEPIADSSLLPAFLISRLTRQHVTVALGGDGGDELFGGYSDYVMSLADEQRFGWVPRPLLAMLAASASRLPAGVRGRNRLSSWRAGPLQQMVWGTPYFDVELRRRILAPEFWTAGDFPIDEPEQWLVGLFRAGADPADCMTRTHFGSILPDDFLVKVDRASMAFALEIRAPFLDYRLIEVAFGEIPSAWKVSRGETRRIERLMSRRMLPPDLDLERKQGFSIPLDDWLRAEQCASVREAECHLPECIRRDELQHQIAGEMRGRANGARLFALTMLGIAARNNGWTGR